MKAPHVDGTGLRHRAANAPGCSSSSANAASKSIRTAPGAEGLFRDHH
jgi:hypothetical protein